MASSDQNIEELAGDQRMSQAKMSCALVWIFGEQDQPLYLHCPLFCVHVLECDLLDILVGHLREMNGNGQWPAVSFGSENGITPQCTTAWTNIE